MKKNIGVVGLWHLGCIISVSWAKLGHKVVGFDYDKERVSRLKDGIPPLYEPRLEEQITDNAKAGRLSFSDSINDLSNCDFIFLSYDTPVRDDDSSDTSILLNSVKDLRRVMKNEAILIVSSQSPVGYCASLRLILKEVNPTLDIAYSPENLRLGEALKCYINPGRIILGTSDKETENNCIELFSQIDAKIIPMGLESAEMVKHGINSFLANSIVFANHLADVCENCGARIDDVIKGMKSDPRIGQKAYLAPGIGFSGGTLGRDLKVLESLNQEHDGFARLFGLVHQLNGERKKAILKRVKAILGDLNGKTIAALGVTYKPGTSTLRRSLPLEIVDLLTSEGASVKIFDPKADYTELNDQNKYFISTSIEKALEKADLAILMTEWNEFRIADWNKLSSLMASPAMFDTKNFLNEQMLRSAGMQYHSVGR